MSLGRATLPSSFSEAVTSYSFSLEALPRSKVWGERMGLGMAEPAGDEAPSGARSGKHGVC